MCAIAPVVVHVSATGSLSVGSTQLYILGCLSASESVSVSVSVYLFVSADGNSSAASGHHGAVLHALRAPHAAESGAARRDTGGRVTERVGTWVGVSQWMAH